MQLKAVVHFAVKDNQNSLLSTYFLQCLQLLHEACRGKNPMIINVNTNGEFLGTNDPSKFRSVARSIVNELRGEGYMVSCGGALWREIHPFLDAHGKIKAKGIDDKIVAIGVLEKQLFREKVLMRCMFAPKVVVELEFHATASGIAMNEGLIDDPPEEYKYEDVYAEPLDPNSEQGKSVRGRRMKSKIHVPNWEGQPKVSYQPTNVSDGRYFWILIEHQGKDEMDNDNPMMHLSGMCDKCEVSPLFSNKYPENKTCANCSANYSLSSYGGYTDETDRQLRVYLAQKTMSIYENDVDWVSYDPNTQLKGFVQDAIRTLLGSPLEKSVSQYGFVRMHPSAAAKMFASSRGHLVITTRHVKTSDSAGESPCSVF